MKTFAEFLTESAGHQFSPAQFPKTLASVHDRERFTVRLTKLCDQVNPYLTGDVPNPVYEDIKGNISHAMEIATKIPESIMEMVRARNQGYFDPFDYTRPTPHIFAGKLKKAKSDAIKDKREVAQTFFAWLIPIIEEWSAMAALALDMKTRAVKRQPKAKEDVQAKYIAPMAAKEVGKMVVDVLTKLTDSIKDGYAKDVTSWYVSMAESAAKLDGDQQVELKRKNPSNIFFTQSDIWEWDAPHSPFARVTRRMVLVSNWRAKLEAEGRIAANDMQQQFLVKNVKKLDSIIEAKGGRLTNAPEILSAQASRGIFEGEIHISFTDGAEFIVRNKIVWKRSQYDRPFNQFPTTFHNVKLAGGTPMPTPHSEERMNTVFPKG